ncbi:MAG: hypothetical protein HOC93_04225 [Phycisphaerae bacterium]|jgi:predicted RNA-binding protein with PIN domain|nr:hypothetical protein [Phycisphaerae bacterium]
MELLVDTWNVLHQMGVLPPDLAGLGVGELASLLSKGRWNRDRISLVCDGTPPPDGSNLGSTRNIEIIYTGGSKTADQEIMDRVAASSTAKRIVVVTNDREIIRFIRAKGAQQLGSVEFLEAIADDHRRPNKKNIRKPAGLSPEKAAAWKEEFGIDAADITNLHEEIKKSEIPQPEPEQIQEEKIQKKPVNKGTRSQPLPEPELPDDLINEARKLAE